MNQHSVAKILDEVMDQLAAIEHERWAHWQKYMHSKGKKQSDGTLVLPSNLVEQWESQIGRPFAQLSESEKESDREQVRKYLPIIFKAFAQSEED